MGKKPMQRSFALWLVIVSSGILVAQDSPVELRWKFQKGQILTYRQQLEGRISVVSEIGVATDLVLKGQMRRIQMTDSVNEDGSALLLVTLEGTVELTAAGSPGPGMPSDQSVSKYAIKDRRFRVRMSADGQVLDLEEIKEKKGADGAVPEVLQDPFQALAISPALVALFPDRLPAEPCRPGKVWEIEEARTVLGAGGQLMKAKVKGQRKFVTVEKGSRGLIGRLESIVEVLNVGEILSESAPLRAMGIDFQADGTSRTQWMTEHLINEGVNERTETTVTTKGTGRVRLPEALGGGAFQFQWATEIKGTARLEAREERPVGRE